MQPDGKIVICGGGFISSGEAWQILEGSASPGGLPLVFVLKSLLLVAPALLVLQGIAEALRAWQRWRHPEDKDGARIADADHAPGEGV